MNKEKLVPKLRFGQFKNNDEWKKESIGNLVTIGSGVSPVKFKHGDYLYVKVNDLNFSSRYQLNTETRVSFNGKANLINKNSIVFPKRGAAILTNKVRILKENSYMDTNMMALTPQKINSDFLYSFISKTSLYKIADTSTIPQINNKHLEPYQIYIPNSSEQYKIGFFFKKIDKMIQLQRSKVNKVKDIKSAYLSEMFPKEGEKYPKRRFEGFTEPWYKNKFNEITEYITSSLSANNTLIQGRYELYDANGLIGYTNSSGQKQEYVTIIKDGSGVGRVRLLPKDSNFIGTMGAIVNKEQTDIHYIYAYLQQFDFTEFITGATVPHVYYRDYGESTAYHPSYEEQVKIGKLFNNLDNQISIEEEKLAKLEKLKQAYLNDMFV